ncbi:MAG: hypothetical protein M3430_05555 [Acidobacteriota bacterium]|nr:hypothetical protein [Acidobacteriota bacterium]
MMTVLARRIVATPARSAAEAWNVIAELLAPDAKSDARREILTVTGIASALIASEAMKESSIVMSGAGPRIRIRCLYDEDAILGDEAYEQAFATCPTEGAWEMSLPCPADDLKWVQNSLKKHSSNITARELSTEAFIKSTESGEKSAAAEVVVDREAFFRT